MGGACSTHGRSEMCTGSFVGKPKGKDHGEHLCVRGKFRFHWILRNKLWGCGLDSSDWGCSEHCNDETRSSGLWHRVVLW